MNIVTPTKNHAKANADHSLVFRAVECTDSYITATFSDGRIVSVPLSWSWRLAQASATERANYQIIGAGHIAYWPDIDEHLSIQGFFSGTPAPRPLAQLVTQI